MYFVNEEGKLIQQSNRENFSVSDSESTRAPEKEKYNFFNTTCMMYGLLAVLGVLLLFCIINHNRKQKNESKNASTCSKYKVGFSF
jgi:heme/copper-type cytochrome/quinol oxidase subunit 2